MLSLGEVILWHTQMCAWHTHTNIYTHMLPLLISQLHNLSFHIWHVATKVLRVQCMQPTTAYLDKYALIRPFWIPRMHMPAHVWGGMNGEAPVYIYTMHWVRWYTQTPKCWSVMQYYIIPSQYHIVLHVHAWWRPQHVLYTQISRYRSEAIYVLTHGV